jgi:uncharacterized protein YndB with AHSA1/START domain
MTVLVLTADIASPPATVFATLADFNGYRRWLKPSGTYNSTEVAEAIRKGTAYSDHVSGRILRGKVLEYEPDRLLLLHQATDSGDLAITIRYELMPIASGTRLVRTGTISTSGWLRLAHPVVIGVTRAENRRTLAALKTHLEGSQSAS